MFHRRPFARKISLFVFSLFTVMATIVQAQDDAPTLECPPILDHPSKYLLFTKWPLLILHSELASLKQDVKTYSGFLGISKNFQDAQTEGLTAETRSFLHRLSMMTGYLLFSVRFFSHHKALGIHNPGDQHVLQEYQILIKNYDDLVTDAYQSIAGSRIFNTYEMMSAVADTIKVKRIFNYYLKHQKEDPVEFEIQSRIDRMLPVSSGVVDVDGILDRLYVTFPLLHNIERIENKLRSHKYSEIDAAAVSKEYVTMSQLVINEFNALRWHFNIRRSFHYIQNAEFKQKMISKFSQSVRLLISIDQRFRADFNEVTAASSIEYRQVSAEILNINKVMSGE